MTPPAADAGGRPGVVDALYRITRLAGASDDPQEALGLILDEIVSVLHASSASIALVNPDTNRLEIEVFRGLPELSKEVQLRLGQGVTGWVALHGEPLVVGDVTQDPRYVPVTDQIQSEMAVPMEEQGIVIGVVNVDSQQLHAFTPEDEKLLTLLTAEATRVVSRLWLIRQLKAKADQLEALLEVGQTLVSTREETRLLNDLTQQARRLLTAKAATLHLLDAAGTHLVLVAADGLQVPVGEPERLSLDESALGTSLQRRKVIEVHDLLRTEEHHLVGFPGRPDLSSLLSAPLRAGDEVFGVLNVYTASSHRFSNEEKRLLATAASLGAVALQNARLYARAFSSEETLRRNERLTTLGLLAAEIAHEIRNPLTVLRLLFDSLGLEFPDSDPRAKDVWVISEKLNQLEDIVSRVLSFGKVREGLHSRYALSTIVQDTLHLVRLKLQQQKVDLEYEDSGGPLVVEGNKGQLQQALLNLLINSTQAMPAGGAISIRTFRGQEDGQPVAVLEVSDTGPGIPADLGERIFDSFLTGTPEGTGLGLAIVKRILKSHHGDIVVASSSPAGATFRLWLPLPGRN